MKLVLKDVLQDVAYQLALIPTYASTIDPDRKTQLIGIANRVIEDAVIAANPQSLLKTFYIQMVEPYTTGTVSILQNGVLVTGNASTAFTAGMVGRKIKIGGGPSVYEIKKYLTAHTVNIDRPYIETTASGATYQIIKDVYNLPVELLKVVGLKDYSNLAQVVEYTTKQLLWEYPDPTLFTQDAVMYSVLGGQETDEAVTAVATTNATQVSSSTLAGTYDDYYLGWDLYNATIGETRRVISSVYGTPSILTLESGITGQATSQTITLKQLTRQIMVRFTPSTNLYLHGVGLMPPKRLVNDSDIDNDLMELLTTDLMTVGMMYKYKLFNQQDSGANFAVLRADYKDLLDALDSKESELANRKYQFSGGRRMEENPIQGPAQWPSYPD